jgi:hypothetical protein
MSHAQLSGSLRKTRQARSNFKRTQCIEGRQFSGHGATLIFMPLIIQGYRPIETEIKAAICAHYSVIQ